jgi:hypothetical protein
VNVPSTLMSQARPDLAQTMMMGGRRQRRQRTRKFGGNRGFSVDPSLSIGGNGPIAVPVNNPIPCDPRAGSMNPLSQTPMHADPRAPSDLYSLTANQTGGSYGLANGYSDACYKAPGSFLPVYPATTAGFRFEPSIGQGATMPDGVTPYNAVVPQAARVGGRRKLRKSLKKHRKNRK